MFPTQYLINKFETKFDTSLLYHYQHQRQLVNQGECFSSHGPYCKFINNRTLGVDQRETDSEEIKTHKQVFMAQQQTEKIKQRDYSIQKFKNQYIFYSEDQDRQFLDSKYFPIQEKNSNFSLLINFDEVEEILQKESTYAKFVYWLDLNKKQLIFQKKFQESPQQFLFIKFKNFYIPSSQNIIIPKQKKMRLEQDQFYQKYEKIDSLPSDIYMQSSSYKNVNDPPTISFSKPVKIEHFYVKRQTLKHPNQDDVFKFKIRAYLNDVIVYTFVVQNHDRNSNNWVKVSGNNLKIDELQFEENTFVDNVRLKYEMDEQDQKLLNYFQLRSFQASEDGIKRSMERIYKGLESSLLDQIGKSKNALNIHEMSIDKLKQEFQSTMQNLKQIANSNEITLKEKEYVNNQINKFNEVYNQLEQGQQIFVITEQNIIEQLDTVVKKQSNDQTNQNKQQIKQNDQKIKQEQKDQVSQNENDKIKDAKKPNSQQFKISGYDQNFLEQQKQQQNDVIIKQQKQNMANSIENIINELDEQDMITILRTEVPIINNKKSDQQSDNEDENDFLTGILKKYQQLKDFNEHELLEAVKKEIPSLKEGQDPSNMNKKEIFDLMLKELNLNEYEMHYYFGNLDEIDLDDIDLNDIDLSIYKKLEISSDEDEEDEYLETVKNSKIEL